MKLKVNLQLLMTLFALVACSSSQTKYSHFPKAKGEYSQSKVKFEAGSALAKVEEGSLTTTQYTPARSPASTSSQANLFLQDTNMGLCQVNSTPWTLGKTGVGQGQNINWSVVSTKGATTANSLIANGYIRVSNSGSGSAPILSILTNLQRKVGKNWVTVSSDIANAFAGDAGTKAIVCAKACADGKTVLQENTASGELNFTDATNNTTFSLSPQKVIGPNQSVNLLFSATYNNSILNIPANEQIRIELVVTFGNANSRTGSGVVCSRIDADGSGTVTSSEQYVRSIPSRITMVVPPLNKNGDQVTLADSQAQISTTGDVTISSFTTDIGGGSGTQLLSSTAEKSVAVSVGQGSEGAISNCATLSSPATTQTLLGPINSTTGLPSYSYNFVCSPGLSKQACDTKDVETGGGWPQGQFVSFTQSEWGDTPVSGSPAALLSNNFASLYPSGLRVGIGFHMDFSTANDVAAYLPAAGAVASLNANLVNPLTTSSGLFGGQVLALRMNVNFSDAGITTNAYGRFGDLRIINTGTSADGVLARIVLSVAEQVLGGSSPPVGFTVSTLNDLVTNLNEAFDNGTPSAWAVGHIQVP